MTTVPDVGSPSATGRRLRAGARSGGARPARPPPMLTIHGRGGAAEGNCSGGHGRETGRHWRVGSCGKGLYFSYTHAADLLRSPIAIVNNGVRGERSVLCPVA